MTSNDEDATNWGLAILESGQKVQVRRQISAGFARRSRRSSERLTWAWRWKAEHYNGQRRERKEALLLLWCF